MGLTAVDKRCLYMYSVYAMKYPDDVIAWKHFPRYRPFVGESTGHRWISSTKGQ